MDILSRTSSLDHYSWLAHMTWSRKLGLSLLMAGITGVFAQIRIMLPWTPVPVTGQVLAVLLCGILLGEYYGGLSTALYLILGFLGLPWFASGLSGSMIGPTAGYLIGFVPAALLIGYLFRRSNRILVQLGAIAGGIAVIHTLGTVHFILFTGIEPRKAMVMTVLPFIPFDLLKGLIAVSMGRVLTTGCARKEATR
jgi:biotin transport system substrate-specific component